MSCSRTQCSDAGEAKVVRLMIVTICRWPLKYSLFKLYMDMRATKPVLVNYDVD